MKVLADRGNATTARAVAPRVHRRPGRRRRTGTGRRDPHADGGGRLRRGRG
ncbi:hypothetical protein ACRAWF_32755 [Streptomyces sp. L7]